MVTFLWYAVEESTRSILLTLQLQDLEGKPWMSISFLWPAGGDSCYFALWAQQTCFRWVYCSIVCFKPFFSWTWSLFSKLWGWGRYAYQSCQSQDVGQWVWKAQSLWIAAVLIQHFIHFKMIFNLSKNFPGCKGGTVNSLVALTDCVCWQRPGQLCLGGELHLRASPVPAFWASVSKVLTLLLPKQQKKILFTFPQRWEVQILHYFSRISRYLYFTWLCLLC